MTTLNPTNQIMAHLMDIWTVLLGTWILFVCLSIIMLVVSGATLRSLVRYEYFTWSHLLLGFSLISLVRYVLFGERWIFADSSVLGYFDGLQVFSALGSSAMYYLLLQLSSRCWSPVIENAEANNLYAAFERSSDNAVETLANDQTAGNSSGNRISNPRGLRRTLGRVEWRTILGLTLFGTLSDMVFVMNSGTSGYLVAPRIDAMMDTRQQLQGDHPLGAAAARVIYQRNSSMDQLGDLSKQISHTDGANSVIPTRFGYRKEYFHQGQARFPDRTVSNSVQSTSISVPTGDGYRHLFAEGDAEGFDGGNVIKEKGAGQYWYSLFDSIPALIAHLSILLSCSWTTMQQWRQVFCYRRRVEHVMQGSFSGERLAKLKRYDRIAMFHIAMMALQAVTIMAHVSVSLFMAMSMVYVAGGRTPTRLVAGRRDGILVVAFMDQLIMQLSFVFWASAAALGLL